MKNITVRTIELKEYIAPEGKLFRKIEVSQHENGDSQESRSYATKLIGENIDINSYDIVDVDDKQQWETDTIQAKPIE